MGFNASEVVEELTYDFNPHHNAKGIIPEPSGKQVDDFRSAIVAALKDTGLDPESLKALSFADMDDVMQKSSDIEKAMVAAVADLTGIANDTLTALPYRIKSAFAGWIMGQFFNPEA